MKTLVLEVVLEVSIALLNQRQCSAHAKLMGGGGHTDESVTGPMSSVDDKIISAGTSSGSVMPCGLIRSPQYYPPSTLPSHC